MGGKWQAATQPPCQLLGDGKASEAKHQKRDNRHHRRTYDDRGHRTRSDGARRKRRRRKKGWTRNSRQVSTTSLLSCRRNLDDFSEQHQTPECELPATACPASIDNYCEVEVMTSPSLPPFPHTLTLARRARPPHP